MRHNRRRTMLTMLGMAWGIATVVLLLAYGSGFGRAIKTIFARSARRSSAYSRGAPRNRQAVSRPGRRLG